MGMIIYHLLYLLSGMPPLSNIELSDEVAYSISRFDIEKAPVFAAGCTVDDDKFSDPGTGFALLYNASDSVLLILKGQFVQVLAGEHYSEEEDSLFWEGVGGVWTINYARDVWDNLQKSNFIMYGEKPDVSLISEIFSQEKCYFEYKNISALDPRPN